MPENNSFQLIKYQALGNDYLVIDLPADVEAIIPLLPAICDRHFGLGSDGLLRLRSGGGGGPDLQPRRLRGAEERQRAPDHGLPRRPRARGTRSF